MNRLLKSFVHNKQSGWLMAILIAYLSLPPLCWCVTHLNRERATAGNVAVLDVWQVVGLAVELYALDVDVGIAVARCLYNELAALDGELGTVNCG